MVFAIIIVAVSLIYGCFIFLSVSKYDKNNTFFFATNIFILFFTIGIFFLTDNVIKNEARLDALISKVVTPQERALFLKHEQDIRQYRFSKELTPFALNTEFVYKTFDYPENREYLFANSGISELIRSCEGETNIKSEGCLRMAKNYIEVFREYLKVKDIPLPKDIKTKQRINELKDYFKLRDDEK